MLEEVLNGGFGFEDNDMWTPLKSLIRSLVVAFSKAGGDPPLLPLDDVAEVSRQFFACCDMAAAAVDDDRGGGGGTGGKPKDSTGLVVILFLAGIFKIPFNCLGPLVNWTTCFDVSLGMAIILGPNITFDFVCKGQDNWLPPEVKEFVILDLELLR